MTRVNSPPKKPPNVFGHTIPAPLVQELEGEEGWKLWQSEVERGAKQYAPTAPMPLSTAHSQGDYPATEPAPLLDRAHGHIVPPRERAADFDAMVTEARRNNRVCPIPPVWIRMYHLLQHHCPDGVAMPSQPLVETAWNATPNLAKRMIFREHLEWADSVGQLGTVRKFLDAMKEEDWHHMSR
jgi:hypothetical protein